MKVNDNYDKAQKEQPNLEISSLYKCRSKRAQMKQEKIWPLDVERILTNW